MRLKLITPLACALLAAAAPALADVKAGVDAWSRGDFPGAVREWQAPADAGDPDAMFNLAQAYRLGRGVATDAKRAEMLYARAAAAGHVEAADTYGLMLFQDGRQKEALPYVQDAARRGDPRAQYLIGVAHFNGDWVPKDWVRAYALVTLSNTDGLPQAAQALAEMDQHIPLVQRQQSISLAQQLRAEADVARKAQLASADLDARQSAMPPARMPAAVASARGAGASLPAVAAVEEARRATGTESPASAGASFARGRTVPQPTLAMAKAVPGAVAAVSRGQAAATVVLPAEKAAGVWKVQLGVFSVAANAPRLWQELSGRDELTGRQRLLVPAGEMTRLLAGGYATRDAAQTACRSLQRSGQACLVTRD